MTDIYESARKFAKDLSETEEVKNLDKHFDELRDNSDAYNLFKSIQELQKKVEDKQASGQQVTNDDVEAMKDLTDQISNYPELQNIVNDEQKITDLMEKLNVIMSKPISDVYNKE